MNLPIRRRAKTIWRNAHEHNGGEEVLHSVLHHERDHDHRGGTGCSRDHARAAAERRCDETHDEGRIEPDERIDVSDQGKRNCLRNQRERDCEAGQKICFRLGVGKKRRSRHGLSST